MSSYIINFGRAKEYFCFQCRGTVSITPSRLGNITCPVCNSDFVQELRNATEASRIQSDDPATLLANITNSLLRSSHNSESNSRSSMFHALPHLARNLAESRVRGGSSDFVSPNYDDSRHILSSTNNTGDYFNGPEFEEFIQQLPEIEQPHCGPPPASRKVVAKMPNIVVDEKMLKSGLAQCAVCKDDFECGTTVKQMPCKHSYHDHCILPWLELHNSCPICRYELPTEDTPYENRRNPGGSGNSNGTPQGSRRRWFQG